MNSKTLINCTIISEAYIHYFCNLKETLHTCIFCSPFQKIMKRSKICINESPTELEVTN